MKDSKADSVKKSKPSFTERGARWTREMRSELKKIQWPSRKQTLNNTMVVIACVLVVGVGIWVFDFFANQIVGALLALFAG